ncbi:acyl-CoA reductase [Roseivirga misakiensis]|uniref:Acyl-CoA reductase n=1 Tax=Roseivirga misakiensis TaxID=1563681 RepID=A0A1E5T0M7_9BACT|nr:acyl-CoA reductase [Roseivirga misakiensis]OEK04933.1 acyl-CoA reductase [Roseivirga misakiensis]
MTVAQRKEALIGLGDWFRNIDETSLATLSLNAVNANNWFTPESVKASFSAWGQVLTSEQIDEWTATHSLEPQANKKIGLIMAGNIPLVGLHDLLAVLIAGHTACVKYSSQDKPLMSAVVNKLKALNPSLASRIIVIEQLKDVDAVIATGSDNSARYFKHYFSKYPHIIRQNRVSVGVINGRESEEELAKIGQDAFQYYGLGCRNVSKLFFPTGYELPKFIKSLERFEPVINHHKFRNNYDYNKSIYLVNREDHLDSGFFLMKESNELVSPISVLFYEFYNSEAELALKLSTYTDKIQCTVSADGWYEGSLPFGEAQCPALWDYADGVDTLEFLSSL